MSNINTPVVSSTPPYSWSAADVMIRKTELLHDRFIAADKKVFDYLYPHFSLVYNESKDVIVAISSLIFSGMKLCAKGCLYLTGKVSAAWNHRFCAVVSAYCLGILFYTPLSWALSDVGTRPYIHDVENIYYMGDDEKLDTRFDKPNILLSVILTPIITLPYVCYRFCARMIYCLGYIPLTSLAHKTVHLVKTVLNFISQTVKSFLESKNLIVVITRKIIKFNILIPIKITINVCKTSSLMFLIISSLGLAVSCTELALRIAATPITLPLTAILKGRAAVLCSLKQLWHFATCTVFVQSLLLPPLTVLVGCSYRTARPFCINEAPYVGKMLKKAFGIMMRVSKYDSPSAYEQNRAGGVLADQIKSEREKADENLRLAAVSGPTQVMEGSSGCIEKILDALGSGAKGLLSSFK